VPTLFRCWKSRKHLIVLVGRVGLEPTTNGLKVP
jgi:hypothetical protein